MKIKNIFKKKTPVTSVFADVQKLEKNQLSQIIGGGDDTTTVESAGTANKTRGMLGHISTNSGTI